MLDLSTEFERLNDEQKHAVRTEGNTVVLAGPGSGKTDTLVIKVAHLLSTSIKPPRGLACITFNKDAVEEFQQRLAQFGIYSSSRIFFGTVHSFCLNCIVRTFGPLVMPTLTRDIRVAPPNRAKILLQRAIDKHLYGERYHDATITRFRRARACNEDVSGFDDRDPLILQDYLDSLEEEGLIDFEGMISAALDLIEKEPEICSYIAARFPWLLVDEYQDLGCPLHQIIVRLLGHAPIKIFAVGDPDQTVYDFTGADPRYLLEFAARRDFETIRLRFNYRSGKRLIVASQVALALAEPRNYEPDPNRQDLGEVYFEQAGVGYDGQAIHIAQSIIPRLDKQGIRREEIAILYRSTGSLFRAILRELDEAGIPFVAERDGLYIRSPFVRWLQRCAAWGLSDDDVPIEFGDLIEMYALWRRQAGLDSLEGGNLESRSRLYNFLTKNSQHERPLANWLEAAERELDLSNVLALAELPDSIEDLQNLIKNAQEGGAISEYTVGDFARDGRIVGKVTVTTLHSSKGRQFDAAIMAGLQETVLPARLWDRARGSYREPSTSSLREDRRLFYVGFTRARRYVFLVYSPTFVNDYGYPVNLGPSRFVNEIQKRLEQEDLK